MTRVTFDTLEYVRRLQEAGVERQTAEAHADLLRDMLWAAVAKTEDLERLETGLRKDFERLETGLRKDFERLETELKSDFERLEAELKADMERLEARLKEDMERLEARLKADIERLEARLKSDLDHKLQELELRMTVKLGGMLAVMAGLIVTAQKLL